MKAGTAAQGRAWARAAWAPVCCCVVTWALVACAAKSGSPNAIDAAQVAPAAPPATSAVPSAPPRRSGFEDMHPATQALQRDDSANPAFLWVQGGEQRFKAGCQGCHTSASLRGVATRYPAFDAHLQRPLSLAQRIHHCQSRPTPGQPQPQPQPFAPDSPALLELHSFVAHQSRGLTLQAPSHPGLAAAVQQGQQLWHQPLGQLAISCAQCHDQLPGRRLSGSTIPQAHATAYPLYRLEWQSLGSLQRRLRGCITGVRAEAFAPDAPEWVALELYMQQRSAGMALETPGVRP